MHQFPSEIPTTFTVPLKETSVTESETATLQCEVSKPDKKVKWLKNGKELKPDDNCEITVDGTVHTLTYKKSVMTDAASYTAKVDKDKTAAKLIVNGESCQT